MGETLSAITGFARIVPRFKLWPGDRVVSLLDMKPDYGIRGLRRHVAAGTQGVVEFTLVFEDAVFYRVHWSPTPEQKRDGWYYIMGDHSPDDVGYLLGRK